MEFQENFFYKINKIRTDNGGVRTHEEINPVELKSTSLDRSDTLSLKVIINFRYKISKRGLFYIIRYVLAQNLRTKLTLKVRCLSIKLIEK